MPRSTESLLFCALQPRTFISSDLIASTVPLEFVPWKGPGYQGRAFGYKAKLLPGVCWVYQDALVAGKLTAKQTHIGAACQALLKALTNYAIEDLVDQATGFDDLRKREAINRILGGRFRTKELPRGCRCLEIRDFYSRFFD